ncbi:MAG: glycoside hydrolase family 28 protein [Luteolibacter sp.]
MKVQTSSARGTIILLVAACRMLHAAELPAKSHYNYSVRDYGAAGDGKTLDSPAINKAIQAAAAAGGGTVLVPAGTYLSGSIRMRSNIHLKIDAGAIILGAPQSLNAYDETEAFPGIAYQDGGHTYFHNSLIWGENLTNVFITGNGRIHGGGLTKDSGPLDEMCGYSHFKTPNTKTYPPIRLGNKALALKLCRNVLIRDVTITHGGHFAILVTGCDNLTVDNVTMDTNRDGIDIDCCRNTVVSNCRINAPGDDGLCIKSTYALGEMRLTENLTITNCQISGFKEGTLLDGRLKPDPWGQGRLKFGTESTGGYRNCTISNCTFRNCWGLALEQVDGGIMENITIENLTMMDIARYPIYITTGKRNRSPDGESVSRMKNILISNVIATGVTRNSGIQITGLPEQSLEGLRLQNIRIVYEGGGAKEQAGVIPKELGTGYPEPTQVMPAYGLFARHVKGLELANITFSMQKDDFRPAIQCVNVNGLEIDNFKAQLAEGVDASKFEKVSGLVIRNSPVLNR